MEVGYNSLFVKKFSHGNSFAIENDVENKRFKIHFLNRRSMTMGVIGLLSIVTMLSIVWGYSANRTPYVVVKDKHITREKKYTKFYEEKYVTCPDSNGTCLSPSELKEEYKRKLESGLKGKNIEVMEMVSTICEVPTLDKYCFSPEGLHKAVTKKEVEIVAEMLANKNILLDEKFEVETFVLFKDFMRTFNKEYKTADEYGEKYGNFRKNRNTIETHNSDPHRLYTMGYTDPADSSDEALEIAILDTSKKIYMPTNEQLSGSGEVKQDKFNASGIIFDWRAKNCVVPVRDQGKCGSCWAFSSADLIASAVAIKTNKLTTYSAQQFLDCILPMFTCQTGGSPMLALLYASDYPYCTEEEYPYDMADFACVQPNKCKNRINIKDIGDLNGKDPEKYLEENGPFLLSMDVRKEFLFYKEGIFDGDMSKTGNHAVLVIGHGYDKEKDAKYWIVKNSWSERWGEEGYFRLLNAHNLIGKKKRYYGYIRENSTGITLG